MDKKYQNICLGCMRIKETGEERCTSCGFLLDEYETRREKHILPAGTILQGKYIVGKKLGSGGFGITYIGYHLNLDCPIAIKEYFPAGISSRNTTVNTTNISSLKVCRTENGSETAFEKGRESFSKEAKTLAPLSLPGIVRVMDCFDNNDTTYIVMNLIEGCNLREYAKKQEGGKLTEDFVLRIFRPVITSLEKLHSLHIIHRDISPDNIILTPAGEAVLIDFGAARTVFSEDDEVQTLTVFLKHGYAPPEQYSRRSRQGPWTDVYSLCASMFRLLTGKTPPSVNDRISEGEIDQELKEHLKKEGVSDRTSGIIYKGMSIRREDRYQSMAELEAALYSDESGKTAPKGSRKEKTEGIEGSVKENKAENKKDNRAENRTDNRTENKTDNRAENKTDNRTENKAENRAENRSENEIGYKTDNSAKSSEYRTAYASASYRNTGAASSGGMKQNDPEKKKSILLPCLIGLAALLAVGFFVLRPKPGNKDNGNETGKQTESSAETESRPAPEVMSEHETGPAANETTPETAPADSTSDAVIDWKDVALENAMREELGIYDRAITDADIEGITNLDLSEKEISDISALAALTSLTKLKLNKNHISDLRSLTELTELEYLSLVGNEIKDLTPLQNLSKIRSLNLNRNQISDLSPLAGLTSLTSLLLGDNSISDISSLENLVNLEILDVVNNQISDISAVTNMKNLRDLSLAGNQISSISALADLTSLTRAYLSYNQISDISSLAGCTSLTHASVDKNSISDISAVSGMTELEEFSFSDNLVSDISALAGLEKLENLYMDRNQIADVSPLAQLTNLKTIFLTGNPVSDLSVLNGLSAEIHS